MSTDDIITPGEISHKFELMFEKRTISLLAYNIETVLAEKLETIISRGLANTRMRDFYDIYILQEYQPSGFDTDVFAKAVENTCKTRASWRLMLDGKSRIADFTKSDVMRELWNNYQRKFDYAQEISWAEVVGAAEKLLYKTGLID